MNLEPVARPKSAEPWKKSNQRSKLIQIVASTVPVAIASGAWLLAGVDLMVAILLVLLPLQLLAVGIAGFVLKGKRGVPDAALIVMTYFLGAFVMVLLISVLWSVVEATENSNSSTSLAMTGLSIDWDLTSPGRRSTDICDLVHC
jgi:hypothetical protein